MVADEAGEGEAVRCVVVAAEVGGIGFAELWSKIQISWLGQFNVMETLGERERGEYIRRWFVRYLWIKTFIMSWIL